MQYKGQLVSQAFLADYTSWRVGGPAKLLYRPADLLDLASYLKQTPVSEPLLWLGLGSNVLIRDPGFAGTVILTQGHLVEMTLVEKDNSYGWVRVEAGVACATMARFCARNELANAEFLAGIPGTMGGALRMNAGCFNGETWDSLVNVETIDRAGNIHHRLPSEFKVSYRHVKLPAEEWFVAATFRLPKGDKQEALDKIRQLLQRRAETQPTGEYNCGSVFRNPSPKHAGQLIESCGLKGFTIGGAHVSPKHANFIINDGKATAANIEAVIEHVENTVEKMHEVKLIREVHIIGEK